MRTYEKRHFLIVGFLVTAVSFLLLLIGVKYILSNDILIQNVIGFFILSSIFGGLSAVFYFFQLKIIFSIFIVGIIIGFFDMYRIFMNRSGGWADLVGLMTLFMWIIIALIIGLAAQFIFFLYKKRKIKK